MTFYCDWPEQSVWAAFDETLKWLLSLDHVLAGLPPPNEWHLHTLVRACPERAYVILSWILSMVFLVYFGKPPVF